MRAAENGEKVLKVTLHQNTISLFIHFLGLERLVRILIERTQLTDDANLNATDKNGDSALTLAAKEGDDLLSFQIQFIVFELQTSQIDL